MNRFLNRHNLANDDLTPPYLDPATTNWLRFLVMLSIPFTDMLDQLDPTRLDPRIILSWVAVWSLVHYLLLAISVGLTFEQRFSGMERGLATESSITGLILSLAECSIRFIPSTYPFMAGPFKILFLAVVNMYTPSSSMFLLSLILYSMLMTARMEPIDYFLSYTIFKLLRYLIDAIRWNFLIEYQANSRLR